MTQTGKVWILHDGPPGQGRQQDGPRQVGDSGGQSGIAYAAFPHHARRASEAIPAWGKTTQQGCSAHPSRCASLAMIEGDWTIAPGLCTASRMAAVRQLLGSGIELMTDANEAWRPDEAIRAFHALRSGLVWIEDGLSQGWSRRKMSPTGAVDRIRPVPTHGRYQRHNCVHGVCRRSASRCSST